MGRTLSKEEYARITSPVNDNDWSRAADTRPKLAQAFKEGADEVNLREWTFRIRYYANGKAWLQNVRGTVPCGWFDVDQFVRAHEQTTG